MTILINDPVEVVHGDAAPEEVAALVAVLIARSHGHVPPRKPRGGGWADHRRAVRAPLRPGPGAWQTSLR